MAGIPKPTREIDAEFTAFVKSKSCCLPLQRFPHECTAWQPWTTQPHHVSKRNGTKSAASKVSDRRQVPVCDGGHRFCERHPAEVLPFLERVIMQLNREFDAMRRPPKRERKQRQRKPWIVQPCDNCNRSHDLPLAATNGEIVHWVCRMKPMEYRTR